MKSVATPPIMRVGTSCRARLPWRPMRDTQSCTSRQLRSDNSVPIHRCPQLRRSRSDEPGDDNQPSKPAAVSACRAFRKSSSRRTPWGISLACLRRSSAVSKRRSLREWICLNRLRVSIALHSSTRPSSELPEAGRGSNPYGIVLHTARASRFSRRP
jgi:hypothetical protein